MGKSTISMAIKSSNHHGSWWFTTVPLPHFERTPRWDEEAMLKRELAKLHTGEVSLLFSRRELHHVFVIQKRWKQKTNMDHGTHWNIMFFSWEGFISNELFVLFLIGFRPQFVTQGCYRILRQEWLELLVTIWECSDFVGQGSMFFLSNPHLC